MASEYKIFKQCFQISYFVKNKKFGWSWIKKWNRSECRKLKIPLKIYWKFHKINPFLKLAKKEKKRKRKNKNQRGRIQKSFWLVSQSLLPWPAMISSSHPFTLCCTPEGQNTLILQSVWMFFPLLELRIAKKS